MTTLPAGASTSSSEVLSSPTGATYLYYLQGTRATIAQFSSTGTLGTPTPLPPDPLFGTAAAGLGPVAFLPNGDAILSWAPDGGQFTLVYRFANGTFGPVLKASNMTSFAARAGEVLAASAGTVQDYSIAADGTMTKNGAAVVLYSGSVLFGESLTAMDADGRADVVINEVTTGPVDFSRSAAGAWGGPHQFGTGTNNFDGATAPGGRAILTYQQGDGQLTDTNLYYAIREPGGTYGAPVLVNSLNALGGALDYVKVAAGPDGTLALAYRSYTCAAPQVNDVPVSSISVIVASPGHPAATTAINGTSMTADTTVGLGPVGAGDGQAIVGFGTNQSSNYPNGTATCTTINAPPNPTSTTTDFVAITGVGSQTFGSSGPAAHPAQLGASSTGLDIGGNAVAMGSLATGGAEFATFGTPGAATATGPPPPPPPPPPGPLPPPTAGPISTPSNVNGQGQQTVTITNPNDFYLNAAVQESGLVTAAADIASVRKPKTVASGKARIAPHKKATVKLKLSKAAQKYLKKHHHLKVVLTITLTATGHKPKLVSKKLTLKRRT